LASQILVTEVVKGGAAGARQGSKEVSKLSIELFTFDFLGLTIKLFAWFFIAVVIDKIHFAVNSLGVNVAVTIASVFGYSLPNASNEPQFFKKLFTVGYFGLKYWDFIKIGAIVLTFIEFMRWYENEKRIGGTPSPFTVGIFTLIILLLGAFTVPELIQKLKTRTPNTAAFP